MTNIFIANLDWEITSEDLKVTFSAFGAVHLAHVVFDAKSKKSKGFGYVEMESAEEAIAAIQALNGFEVNGRKLDVKIASPKSNRPKPEDKPKKPFAPKGGGFGGQKRQFNNNGPRPGGGGGGYRSNEQGVRKPWENSSASSGGSGERKPWSNNAGSGERKPWENRDSDAPKSDEGSSSTGERKLRPRRNPNT
jgi:RNA recognition motif-containing protein